MSIPATGSRRIVVDGVPYRWSVRAKPTYSQGLAWQPLSFAVVMESHGHCALVVNTADARPDNWVLARSSVVSPRVVAMSIRAALERGWRPLRRGKPFVISDVVTDTIDLWRR